jgi:hypothetical protein
MAAMATEATTAGPVAAGRPSHYPVLGAAAVLMGAFVVNFDTRLFSIGLPDLRGAFGLSFDEGAWLGSVSARASKYSWLDEGRDFSGGLQHPQNRCGAAKEVEPAVIGGDLLIGSGAGTEKVA